MILKSYRKKPALVEATQWDGGKVNAFEIIEWIERQGGSAQLVEGEAERPRTLNIEAQSGEILALRDDWIIKGAGGFFSSSPENFASRYEDA